MNKTAFQILGIIILFLMVRTGYGLEQPVELEPVDLAIDFTSSIHGHLEPCGCASGSYGGIARRATYLHSVRNIYPNVLLLYNGDLSEGISMKDQIRADYLFQAFKKMQFDVFNIGEREFLYGWDFLNDKNNENPIFISANVLDSRTGEPVFPTHRVTTFFYQTEDKKNIPIKIAIIGLMGISQFHQLKSNLQSDSTRFRFAEPMDILPQLIPELRQSVDLIIVMADMNQPQAESLAQQIAGIDILISGHDRYQMVQNPKLIGRTILLTNGDRGRFGAILELRFNNEKRIRQYRTKQIALSSLIPDDPEQADLVQQYLETIQVLPMAADSTEPVGQNQHLTTHPVD